MKGRIPPVRPKRPEGIDGCVLAWSADIMTAMLGRFGSRVAFALLGLSWISLSGLAQQPFDGQGRPNRSQPGPWQNDVLVFRVSRDGGREPLATFPRAGVPTLARLPDGRLIAAHQHFPDDNDADFDKVAVRFSSDMGRTWTDPAVIRLEGWPEGMRFPFDPTLVALPDGRVRLYCTSVRGRRIDLNPPAIYSAVSSDGVTFTVEPGVRFEIEGRPVIDSAVVLHRGVFHLFAPDNGPAAAGIPAGGPGDGEIGVAYHATSPDGLRFTRQPDLRIEGRRRWLGNAQSEGEVIRFFGTGGPPAGRTGAPATPGTGSRGRGAAGPGGIWTGTSPDGSRWQLDVTLNVPGADPGAVQVAPDTWIVVATGPPARSLSR
jgi:hypothetical protein